MNLYPYPATIEEYPYPQIHRMDALEHASVFNIKFALAFVQCLNN